MLQFGDRAKQNTWHVRKEKRASERKEERERQEREQSAKMLPESEYVCTNIELTTYICVCKYICIYS